MTKMHAIPTLYSGVRFRSRLEARWARFFDLVKWRWEYEPIDLAGYIPDFVLLFDAPVLVEVKPATDVDQLWQYRGKIERSGWEHEAILVGAAMFEAEGERPCLGALGGRDDAGSWEWSRAIGCRCAKCQALTFYHETGSWVSRACGHYDGNSYLGDDWGAINDGWRRASNAVQWNPTTDDYPDWDEVLP